MDGMRDGGAWLKMRWSCLNIYHPDAIEMLLLHPLIYDTCVTIFKRFIHTYIHIYVLYIKSVKTTNIVTVSVLRLYGLLGKMHCDCKRVMHQIYHMFCPCQEDKLVL